MARTSRKKKPIETEAPASPSLKSGKRSKPKVDKTEAIPPPEAAAHAVGESGGPTMIAPKDGIRVRMYRTGLGDCFLLALPSERNERDFFILIDCGVFFRSPAVEGDGKSYKQEEWIREIVTHIKAETKGRIDLLMITHEHWDHVSAFDEGQARSIFESIALGALWLPWTEDMSIPLAKKLKAEGGAEHEALAKASEEMDRRQMTGSATTGLVKKVLGFFGAKGSKYSKQTGEAMRWIQEDYSSKNGVTPRYLHPGGPIEHFDGVSPDLARMYVLGPPEDERVIKVLERAGTTYRMGAGWPQASASFLAFGVLPPAEGGPPSKEDIEEARRMSIPFDETHQVPLAKIRAVTADQLDQARKDLKNRIPLDPSRPEINPFYRDRYLDNAAGWRKIDDAWAEPAGAFALQLDSKTNNTSLAFALEIGPPGKGKVLLFPGDAQVGNWLSWFGPVKIRGVDEPIGKVLSWDVDGKVITAEDLLRRAVLYKVGHHGSHNATLMARDKKDSGLKLMGSEDGKTEFVAMLPVDESVARTIAGYGDMPKPGMMMDLLRRTEGKIARNDQDLNYSVDVAPVLNGKDFPADVPKANIKLQENVSRLSIDYVVRA